MEFTSQICTSRSQSERLLALGLKKKTADMEIHSFKDDEQETFETGYANKGYMEPELAEIVDCFPAWSLHRLKCLIPENTPYGNGYLTVEIINENVYIVLVIENVEQRVLKYTKGNLYDNLISCINFFVKESLFNKEYLE